MGRTIALDKAGIVSGKPLPFSVFDPGRKLLLAAKGQIVTERMREALLRNGLVAVVDEGALDSRTAETAAAESQSPLLQLRQQYARASAISRAGFRMSRDERSEGYPCHIIGVGERRGLILTAPIRDDRGYIAISEGQSWLFRTFYATAAIRFQAVIEKVLFDPFPYFHVEVPALVEMRHVRKMQRVAVCLGATIDLGAPIDAVIVDLSATGMRIAVDAGLELQESQRLRVSFRVTVLDREYELNPVTTVVRRLGVADLLHPNVVFYGLGLEAGNDFDRLVLYAYVQGCLALELDGLSKVLAG